jgi:hypothetical protein
MGSLLGNVINSIKEAPAKNTILRSMAIFTGIELCGKILIGRTGRGTTESSFEAFCESKYIPSAYHQYSELLYKLFRCGVLHTYTPRGGALLSSETPGKDSHLTCYEDGLFIYIPTLAEDVIKGIESLIVDLNKDPHLAQNYQTVLNDLDFQGTRFYHEFLEDKHIDPQKGRFNFDIGSDIN